MSRQLRCPQLGALAAAETIAEPSTSSLPVTAMDIRIGLITKVDKHPDADRWVAAPRSPALSTPPSPPGAPQPPLPTLSSAPAAATAMVQRLLAHRGC
jgi:hypothetical protein